MSIKAEDLLQVLREAARSPWLALAAAYVFLALNVDFARDLRWHDGQRLAQVVVLAMAGFLVLLPERGREIAMVWMQWPHWARSVMSLVLLLGLWSAAVAPLPRWALLECVTFVLLLVLAIGVASAWRHPEARREEALVCVFYAAALAYCVKTATVYVTMIAVGPAYDSGFAVEHLGFAVEELFTGFSNVRFFSQVQTLLLPFLLLPAMCWTRTRLQVALLAVVPLIWWMLLIASGTRGTWVAMLAAAVLATLCCGIAGRRWLRWQVFGLVAGLALYVLLIIVLPELLLAPEIRELASSVISRRGEITSLRGREELWQLSLGLIVTHPWLGIGPMHFAQRLSEIGAHPHNSLLQFAVEWGLPVMFLLLAVTVITGARWLLKVYRDQAQAEVGFSAMVQVALLAAISGAAVQSLVDGTLVMPVSQMTLALLVGWAMGRGMSMPMPTVRLRAYGMRFVAAAAAAGLLWAVAPEIGSLAQRELDHLKALKPGPTPRLQARYWTHGWIPD